MSNKDFRYSTEHDWFKGNTHIHSIASDGGKTIVEIAELYSKAQYDFIFCTDHWVSSDIEENGNNSPLLLLDGIEFDGKDNYVTPNYIKAYGMNISSDDPSERVIASASSGMMQLFALFRTRVLLETYLLCGELSRLVEFSVNYGGMFFGKHIMLSDFWMARDVLRYTDYSEYNYGKSKQEKFSYKMRVRKFLQNDNQGLEYKKKFSNLFNTVTGGTLDAGDLLFEKAIIDGYLSDVIEKEKFTYQVFKSTIYKYFKSCFKYFLPKFFLKWRRRRICKFPFNENINYITDWNLIDASIRKHGNILSHITKKA